MHGTDCSDRLANTMHTPEASNGKGQLKILQTIGYKEAVRDGPDSEQCQNAKTSGLCTQEGLHQRSKERFMFLKALAPSS